MFHPRDNSEVIQSMIRLAIGIPRWNVHVLLAILSLHAVADWGFGESKLVEEEMIDKWQAYESFSRSLQGTSQQTTTWDSGKTERVLIHCKQNRDCVMSCSLRDNSLDELCRFGNPRYAASVKRSKSDSDKVSLERFTQEPKKGFPGITGPHTSVFELTSRWISPHFTVFDVPLSQFAVDPAVTILKRSKDGEFVRFDYTYTSDNVTTGSHSSVRGSITLDPSRCWCLRRSKTSSATTRRGSPVMDAEHEVEYEIIDHPSGFPLIKTRLSQGYVYPYKTKKKLTSRARIDYEWEVNDSVPDAEFTLSAFGLPEPMGVESPERSRTWLWLISAALGLVALALLFTWLKRRRISAGKARAEASSVRSIP